MFKWDDSFDYFKTYQSVVMKVLNLKFILFIVPLIGFSFSCAQKNKGIIKIELNGDSVKVYAIDEPKNIKVFRELTILENTLTDTILLGYSVVPVNYIGKILYTKEGETALYIDEHADVKSLPKIDSIFVYRFNNRVVKGKLLIEYTYN